MNLLIGIPAYNESATIAEVIQKVPKRIAGIKKTSIVVVDDGSTDKTGDIAKKNGAHVIRHYINQGVGSAFQSILQFALQSKADILVTIDGDGQFHPKDISTLIKPIIKNETLVTTASRFLDPKKVPKMPWVKKWGNKRVAQLISRISGRELYDVSCGFRAYSREALLKLNIYSSFTYTHETFLDLSSKSVPIHEVPISVKGVREHGESKVAASVLKYAMRTSAIILRFYRDHKPLKLCIYLSLPFILLGTFLLTISFIEWLNTDTWLKWAGFSGGVFFGVASLITFFGFMSDMNSRLRRNQEEIIYLQRKMPTE